MNTILRYCCLAFYVNFNLWIYSEEASFIPRQNGTQPPKKEAEEKQWKKNKVILKNTILKCTSDWCDDLVPLHFLYFLFSTRSDDVYILWHVVTYHSLTPLSASVCYNIYLCEAKFISLWPIIFFLFVMNYFSTFISCSWRLISVVWVSYCMLPDTLP